MPDGAERGCVVIALVLLQLALVCGYAVTRALAAAGLPPRTLLVSHRVLLVLALLAPAVPTSSAPWRPPAQVFDGATRVDVPIVATRVTLPAPPPADAPIIVGPLAILGIYAGFRLALDLRALRRATRVTRPWRRVGGLDVRVGVGSYAACVPRRIVVIDERLTSDPRAFALALRHEVQHHRQGDAAWAWAWRTLTHLFGWNPAVVAWARLAAELEEFACDAAVVRTPGVSPRAYGRLLLASAAPSLPFAPALSRSLLHRRITMLAAPRAARPLRSAALALAGVAALLVSVVTTAGLAADHRLTDAEWAAARAAAAKQGVVVPDVPAIRAELARMRASDFWRRGLSRRSDWAPLVDDALAEAGLPRLLAAVPMVESGYSNWGAPAATGGGDEAESAAPGRPGRGLWMFIAPTARLYGMRVDATTDERLDPARETAAAVAYLSDLHERFGDWDLALAGYNMGPSKVEAAIAAAGTRDPWALEAGDHINRYAATVEAAAMLLAAPELLD